MVCVPAMMSCKEQGARNKEQGTGNWRGGWMHEILVLFVPQWNSTSVLLSLFVLFGGYSTQFKGQI
jgi:hypothetical protein